MSGLPSNWDSTALQDLVTITMGQAPPGDMCNKNSQGTPFVKAGEFSHERPIIREWTTRPLKFARRSDVLMCVVGATCGKINYGEDCSIGRSVAALTPNAALDQRYLYNFLSTKIFDLRSGSVGSAQGVISRDSLNAIRLPLAPAAEQRRIVAKLESLFARSKAARAELARISPLIRRAKEAHLRSAFDDPGYACGKVADIVTSIEAGKNVRCIERPPEPDEIGVVKVSAVTWGKFDPKASKTLPLEFIPPPHTLISEGDFLFSRANTIELVGACVIVEDAPANLYLSDKILRLGMAQENKPWLLWYLRSPSGRSALEAVSSGNQLSMRNISQSGLLNIKIPLPPMEIRQTLVTRIESTFAKLDATAREVRSATVLLDHLDEACLAKAFRGELVPQDPNDEPASVLLERIRAERAARPAARSRQPRGSRPQAAASE